MARKIVVSWLNLSDMPKSEEGKTKSRWPLWPDERSKSKAPVVIRDAMLALLKETRSNARRERWILGMSAAGLVIAAIALLVAVLFPT